jgi:hypothetical protein
MSSHYDSRKSPWFWRSIGLGVMGIALLGCNDDEHKKQLDEAKLQADKRVAEVEAKAKEEVSGLKKQIETLKAEAEAAAAKAKTEADDAIEKAKADADDAEKETSMALKKAREAYKSEAKARYGALNTELSAVTAKTSKVPAAAKAAYDKTLKDLVALQQVVTKDIAAYDEATLDTFAKTKGKLDQDLAKYKALVATAKAKLPK